MREVSRRSAVLATGAACFAAGYFPSELLRPNPNETNKRIERCAQRLGKTTLDAADIPKSCERYEHLFDRTTTTVIRSNPTTGPTNVISESVTYHLPPVAEFREYITTPEEEDREKFGPIAAGGLASILGMMVMFIGMRSNRRAGAAALEDEKKSSE